MDPRALDGNAAAGPLSQLFAVDMTLASTVCATCHDRHSIAELHAYMQAPGLVLRCTSCGEVQMRFVRGPGRAWLDLGGVQVLDVPMAEAPGTAP